MNGTIGLLVSFLLQAQVATAPPQIGSPREVGWMLDKQDGKLVVIVQVSPLEAKQMQEQRLENVSYIPKELLGRFDRVAVRIGTAELPRVPSMQEILRLPSYSTASDLSRALNDRGPGQIADFEPRSGVVNVQNSQPPALPSLDGFGHSARDKLSDAGDRARDALENPIDRAAAITREARDRLLGSGNSAATGGSLSDQFLSGARGLPDTARRPETPSTSSRFNSGNPNSGNPADANWRSSDPSARLADSRFDFSLGQDPSTTQNADAQRGDYNIGARDRQDLSQRTPTGGFGSTPGGQTGRPDLLGTGSNRLGNPFDDQRQGLGQRNPLDRNSNDLDAQALREELARRSGAQPGATAGNRDLDNRDRGYGNGYGGGGIASGRGYGNENYANESLGTGGYADNGYGDENYANNQRGNQRPRGGRANARGANNGYGNGSGYGVGGYSGGYGAGGYGASNYGGFVGQNGAPDGSGYNPMLANGFGFQRGLNGNPNALMLTPQQLQAAIANGLQPGPFQGNYGYPASNNSNQLGEKKAVSSEDLSPELLAKIDAATTKSASDKAKEAEEAASAKSLNDRAESNLAKTGNVLVQMFFLVSLVANCYLVYLIRKLLVRYRSLLSTVRSHAIA